MVEPNFFLPKHIQIVSILLTEKKSRNIVIRGEING